MATQYVVPCQFVAKGKIAYQFLWILNNSYKRDTRIPATAIREDIKAYQEKVEKEKITPHNLLQVLLQY